MMMMAAGLLRRAAGHARRVGAMRAASLSTARKSASPSPAVLAAGAAVLGGGAYYYFGQRHDGQPAAKAAPPGRVACQDLNTPRARPDLPTITLAELKAHTTAATGYWVAYKGAVYDVTSFVNAHPGGAGRIEMAAGNDLGPLWDVYRLHLRGHIVPLLEEKYRIGTLSAADAREAANFVFDDPYKDDPPRAVENTACTHKPYCGEARIDLLCESYFTPNELFYTRNHNTVPNVSEDEWELIVEGNGVQRTRFTMKDLKTKFEKVEVVSTIQCAGNRGEDFHGMGKGSTKSTFLAPHWTGGAISNAKWGGVRIRDVLKAAGLDVDGLAANKVYMTNATHVKFWAYDCDETGEEYGASTYIDKARHQQQQQQ